MDGCPNRRTGREDLKDLQGRKYTAQSELDFLRCVLVEDRRRETRQGLGGGTKAVGINLPWDE